MEFAKSLSRHEELLFRSLVLDLYGSALEETEFSKVMYNYKKLCASEGMKPLSLMAAYHHLLDLSRFVYLFRLSLKLISSIQLVFINSERGELHCKVKLAFSITEAQFCIRQLDSQKCKDAQTQMADSSVIKSASKSPRKRECSFSPSNRVLRSSSNTANAKELRVSRKIDFESHQ